MDIQYLTVEEVLLLHFRLIEDFGGSHGVRDEGRLKSAIEASRQHVFQSAQYPSVHAKAAVYLRNIIGGHPFTDGNKRTAVTVCGIFLGRNGLALTIPPQELEDLAVRVAVGRMSVEAIAEWLGRCTTFTDE